MRIVWNNNENWFQVELSSEYWVDDKQSVQQAGFKTTGPPEWIWKTQKAAILNKLRDIKPKSGLIITETALEKYKLINEQESKKKELKKQFEKQRKAAQQNFNSRPEYEKDGFVSFIVEQKDKLFIPTYVKPEPPAEWCFVCGDPVYNFEALDLCLWCEEKI